MKCDVRLLINLLESSHWQDYALLDSGGGLKLERFGRYVFVRPESQAMWKPALPPAEWARAHAVFQPTGEESGGHWMAKKPMEEKWQMRYPLPRGSRSGCAAIRGDDHTGPASGPVP